NVAHMGDRVCNSSYLNILIFQRSFLLAINYVQIAESCLDDFGICLLKITSLSLLPHRAPSSDLVSPRLPLARNGGAVALSRRNHRFRRLERSFHYLRSLRCFSCPILNVLRKHSPPTSPPAVRSKPKTPKSGSNYNSLFLGIWPWTMIFAGSIIPFDWGDLTLMNYNDFT
ncbi:hypothetical protein D0Y65_025838, partial [Glycine soja]